MPPWGLNTTVFSESSEGSSLHPTDMVTMCERVVKTGGGWTEISHTAPWASAAFWGVQLVQKGGRVGHKLFPTALWLADKPRMSL